MKAKFLFFVFAYFSNYLNAQLSNQLYNKYINELEAFKNCREEYTKIKTYFSVEFIGLPKKYFAAIDTTGDFLIDPVILVNKLETAHQQELAFQLREKILAQFSNLYDYYSDYPFQGSLLKNDKALPWKGFPLIVFNDSLIDISKSTWKQESNGYKIISKPDSSNDILNFWSANPFPEKIDSRAVQKEIQLFCYNKDDERVTGKRLDSVSNTIQKLKNTIPSDIYGLVNSGLYNKYYIGVPGIIRSWLNEALENVRKIIPPGWPKEAKEFPLSFSRNGTEVFWFKVSDREILLSPYLIRAVYMRHFQTTNSIDINLTKKSYWKDIEFEYSLHKKRFIANFYFLLLHELAHLNYNSLGIKNIEECCDCKALELLQQNNYPVSLGIFESILIQSIKEAVENVWDYTEPQALLNRLSLLKNADGKYRVQNCDSVYLK